MCKRCEENDRKIEETQGKAVLENIRAMRTTADELLSNAVRRHRNPNDVLQVLMASIVELARACGWRMAQLKVAVDTMVETALSAEARDDAEDAHGVGTMPRASA